MKYFSTPARIKEYFCITKHYIWGKTEIFLDTYQDKKYFWITKKLNLEEKKLKYFSRPARIKEYFWITKKMYMEKTEIFLDTCQDKKYFWITKKTIFGKKLKYFSTPARLVAVIPPPTHHLREKM